MSRREYIDRLAGKYSSLVARILIKDAFAVLAQKRRVSMNGGFPRKHTQDKPAYRSFNARRQRRQLPHYNIQV